MALFDTIEERNRRELLVRRREEEDEAMLSIFNLRMRGEELRREEEGLLITVENYLIQNCAPLPVRVRERFARPHSPSNEDLPAKKVQSTSRPTTMVGEATL
ncbi:unnamed protein product [Sympodiomycopsis kandeliae]